MDGVYGKRIYSKVVLTLAVAAAILVPSAIACNGSVQRTEASPHLVIDDIAGGMGVTVKIKNDGDANATNVLCAILVTGGMMGRVNVSKSNLLTGILVGGAHTMA